MNKYRGLGKGLSDLIGENSLDEGDGELKEIHLSKIIPNPNQPRTNYKEEELDELTNSILTVGVIQPIIISKTDDDKYQIVAGERRWRAAIKAGLNKIPAIVKSYSNTEIFEVALIENIQRENLSPLEEAEAYNRLIKVHGYTQEKISSIVHKSRSHISNLIRVLSLPDQIKTYLEKGLLSLGHLKLLINEPNNLEIAERIIHDNLSVRDTEELINELKAVNTKEKDILKKHNKAEIKDIDLESIENILAEHLGLEVKIRAKSKQSGQIIINYRNIHNLDDILTKITRSIKTT